MMITVHREYTVYYDNDLYDHSYSYSQYNNSYVMINDMMII